MALLSFSIAPTYLSVYLAGWPLRDVPYNFAEVNIPSTPDCISIPCIYWNEGDTNFVVGAASEISPSTEPNFDGMLNTPYRKLVFFDAEVENFATMPVPTVKTRIRVWIDHPRQPQNVVVAWGE
jgi:hypothetical protein